MVYNIEFIRRVDGRAGAPGLSGIQVVADGLRGMIAQAEKLYRQANVVPRPDGFRIRDAAGGIVHEFYEPRNA